MIEDDETPHLGDTWVGENELGCQVFKLVTSVELPTGLGDDPLISLDDSPPRHLGWWLGQGWEPLE
jgi:hypothetical protein